MDIVLATLNARYIHASFGLRSLRANLGALRERSVLREFTLQDRPVDVVEALLREEPRLIGLGVYVWNAVQSLAVVRLLKQVAPQVTLVLGGPEVSHELDRQEIVSLADHVITGEGERAFAELAAAVLGGRPTPARLIGRVEGGEGAETGAPMPARFIPGGLPDLTKLAAADGEYTDQDLAHRVVYVEASRGCPFSCEFCLSSLDREVRAFPLAHTLASLERLIQRGARQLKFVDRTFNLSVGSSLAILDFLLERQHLGLFAHFELVPDRLPEPLRERLARFPPGALQLELGVQSFDAQTVERIGRRQDALKVDENLRWLKEHSKAHVHADLIVGLPGEDVATFARGFDRLVELTPQEIQVGILKRLRGTPIHRHDQAYSVVWSAEPPYEILQNRLIPFAQMQRLKRFARAWDLVANRGNFPASTALLWQGRSPFDAFLEFTDWLTLHASLGGIALPRLAELVLQFLVDRRGLDAQQAGPVVTRDYLRSGRRVPKGLLAWSDGALASPAQGSAPARQRRHLQAEE